MQRITDRVSQEYLSRPPARSLPFGATLDLIGDYLVERPLQTLLDPVLIVSILLLGVLLAVGARWAILLPLGIIALWLGRRLLRLWRVVSEEIALLRKGLIVKAHILKLQPHRTITGEIDGALLACAIPVKTARTYVGSIWLADGHEALRLMHQGQLDVICLPRAPGTWRVIEPVQSQIRYDRVGPIPDIPRDF